MIHSSHSNLCDLLKCIFNHISHLICVASISLKKKNPDSPRLIKPTWTAFCLPLRAHLYKLSLLCLRSLSQFSLFFSKNMPNRIFGNFILTTSYSEHPSFFASLLGWIFLVTQILASCHHFREVSPNHVMWSSHQYSLWEHPHLILFMELTTNIFFAYLFYCL